MSSLGLTPFNFGSLDFLCYQVAYPFCALLGEDQVPTVPKCFSRNVEIGGKYLFQVATLILHIGSLVMTFLMIHNIRTNYTAVGRKEIVQLFICYCVTIILDFLLVSNIIPWSSGAYLYITSLHVGLVSATIWCMFVNGFIGFQWIEDGTRKSIWIVRLTTLAALVVHALIAYGTFSNWGSVMTRKRPLLLFIFYVCFNLFEIIAYLLMQIALVFLRLESRTPIGSITIGFGFFVIGQLLAVIFSQSICDSTNHYVDGMFFAASFNLLGMMMVYKFWDSITKEDWEFSIPYTKAQQFDNDNDDGPAHPISANNPNPKINDSTRNHAVQR